MNAFWVGLIFALFYEIRKLLHLRRGKKRVSPREAAWHFFTQVPSFFAASFLAGVIANWAIATGKNYVLRFAIVLFIWAVTILFETAICEILGAEDKGRWNATRLRRAVLGSVLYCLGTSIASIPYFYFPDDVGCDLWHLAPIYLWITSLTVVFFGGVGMICWAQAGEEAEAKESVQKMLVLFLARQAPKLYEDSLFEQFLGVVDVEQIRSWKTIVSRHRTEVYNFAIESDGELIPGISQYTIPRFVLSDISRQSKEEHWLRCEIVIRTVDALVGSLAEAEEAFSWFKDNQNSSSWKFIPGSLEKLHEQRAALSPEPARQ